MQALFLLVVAASCVSAVDVADGYGVQNYVTGDSSLAITFCPQGDLYTWGTLSGSSNCLYKYPAAELANSSALPLVKSDRYLLGCTAGVTEGDIVCTSNGRIYTASGYELNVTDGSALRRVWQAPGDFYGIALDPRDGGMLFSSNPAVYHVPNPDTVATTLTPTLFYSAGQIIDGIAIGPDGTAYLAGVTTKRLIIVEGFNNLGQGTVRAQLPLPESTSYPDGISICGQASGATFLMATTAAGQAVARFNLTGPGGAPTYAAQNVVTNTGGYNDWSAVDPASGCIFFSDWTHGYIRRITINGGCPCFSAQAAASGSCADNVVVAGSDCARSSASSTGSAVSLSIGNVATGLCNFVNGAAV